MSSAGGGSELLQMMSRAMSLLGQEKGMRYSEGPI